MIDDTQNLNENGVSMGLFSIAFHYKGKLEKGELLGELV